MSARSRNFMNKGPQSGSVICYAAGCIEVNRLERTHERPTPAETVADSSIDVLAAGHPVFHQSPCFTEKGCLNPVQHKTLILFAHMDNAPLERAHEGVCKVDGRGRGFWRWNQFNHGYEIGRIHRLNDQAAPCVFQAVREGRGRKSAAGTRAE